jgi:exonuclease SbcC
VADGSILTTHIKDKTRIAEITGLTLRALPSMLLAQGGFAAFLQATANERAELLEELTGTDIYGRDRSPFLKERATPARPWKSNRPRHRACSCWMQAGATQ